MNQEHTKEVRIGDRSGRVAGNESSTINSTWERSHRDSKQLCVCVCMGGTPKKSLYSPVSLSLLHREHILQDKKIYKEREAGQPMSQKSLPREFRSHPFLFEPLFFPFSTPALSSSTLSSDTSPFANNEKTNHPETNVIWHQNIFFNWQSTTWETTNLLDLLFGK